MQELLFNYQEIDTRSGSVFDLIFEPQESGHQWAKIAASVRLGTALHISFSVFPKWSQTTVKSCLTFIW